MSGPVVVRIDTKELASSIERLSSINGGRGERLVRKLIGDVVKRQKKDVIADASCVMTSDPRKASRAVRHSIYKRILGGSIDILQRRRAGKAMSSLDSRRALRPGQHGGNRRKRSARTNQVDGYYGADRGFILRFQNAGTEIRKTKFGVRGKIHAKNWFRQSSERAMKAVAEEVQRQADDIVKSLWNG